jgi:DNA-binding SARP family transcriptional activator
MPIELKIFGAVSAASSGSGSPARLTQPRPLALLTYLALARPRGPQSRDTLTALLWPDADQASARQGLRNALHRIRTTLGEGLIVTSGETLVSVDRSRIDCDALSFENAVEEERWGDAVSLFSGEPLQGFHVENASELDGWLDSERARLRETAARAAWAHASALRAVGDAAGAIAAARRAHSLSRDDERSLRRLLDLLAAAGDSAAAIKAYDDFAKRMAAEFDAEPSSETRAVIAPSSRRFAPASPSGRASSPRARARRRSARSVKARGPVVTAAGPMVTATGPMIRPSRAGVRLDAHAAPP